MPSRMAFLPELARFLRENGRIYTVRQHWLPEKSIAVKDVGTCRRLPCVRIYEVEELRPYVSLSGFSTVEEWWSMITFFIPYEKSSKYLYEIVRGGQQSETD